MNRDSIQKLRLDRRMLRRQGWISEQELESALEALPDVSEKMTTLGEADPQKGDASAESSGDPAPA